MAIRLPLKTVLASDNSSEVGAGSVGGIVAIPFVIPQDTDNVVVKLSASIKGGFSAILQTTDDGGTTYYDVARTSVISNGKDWLSAPIAGLGVRSGNVAGSILTTIKSATSNTTNPQNFTGLPILSQQGRIALVISGDVVAAADNSLLVEVKVNSQSATA